MATLTILEYTNKDILNRYHIGGARYQGGNKQQVQALLNDFTTT